MPRQTIARQAERLHGFYTTQIGDGWHVYLAKRGESVGRNVVGPFDTEALAEVAMGKAKERRIRLRREATKARA